MPLAGGVCAECWEERASALHQEFLDLKAQVDSIAICAKHLKEIKRPAGCPVCKNAVRQENLVYLSGIVLKAAEALDAQTAGDPKADKLLEVALEGLLKAGEFVKKMREPRLRA